MIESEIENEDYMSDNHDLYREDTGTLEVWYRLTTRDVAPPLPTKIIRKTTQDGESWSDREDMAGYTLMTDKRFMRSSSIIYDTNIEKYHMWYTNCSGLSPLYSESTDGKNWSDVNH